MTVGGAAGQGADLARMFGWLGGEASGPPRPAERRDARAIGEVPRSGFRPPRAAEGWRVGPHRAAEPMPGRRRTVLVLPFLLLHPGLVPAGFALPAALGIAVSAVQFLWPAAPAPAALAPVAGPARPTEAAQAAVRALEAAEQDLAAANRRLAALEGATDPRAAAGWREALRQEADRLRQRREAARATLDASRKLLAGQPGSVLALKETTAQQAGEEARATLLRLQVEREHLAAQYVPSYPALRELDRKIATARAALEEHRRPSVSRTQEVRNPALDALGSRAALAQVDLAAADAQLAEVDRQLAEAEARRAELAAAETGVRDAEGRRDALRRELAAADRPIARPVPAPGTPATGPAVGARSWPQAWSDAWYAALLPAWIGLACGAVLALVLWMVQRRALGAARPRARTALPVTELLPPPAWPLVAVPAATPTAIWDKPGVGMDEPIPRLRPPVGAGCRWE